MDLFDACLIAAVLCLMESRNCYNREKMWLALAEIDERKKDNDTTR